MAYALYTNKHYVAHEIKFLNARFRVGMRAHSFTGLRRYLDIILLDQRRWDPEVDIDKVKRHAREVLDWMEQVEENSWQSTPAIEQRIRELGIDEIDEDGNGGEHSTEDESRGARAA
jgi:hypothetical protein